MANRSKLRMVGPKLAAFRVCGLKLNVNLAVCMLRSGLQEASCHHKRLCNGQSASYCAVLPLKQTTKCSNLLPTLAGSLANIVVQCLAWVELCSHHFVSCGLLFSCSNHGVRCSQPCQQKTNTSLRQNLVGRLELSPESHLGCGRTKNNMGWNVLNRHLV